MKKIINQKRYDTDTAKEMGYDCYNGSRSDFQWWQETLYRKQTGEFFLHGEGGAMSRYAEAVGNSSWCGGERIMPLTVEEAQKWAEKHLTADEYESIFGAVEEMPDKRLATYSLTEGTIEKITRLATTWKCTKSEVIDRLVAKA